MKSSRLSKKGELRKRTDLAEKGMPSIHPVYLAPCIFGLLQREGGEREREKKGKERKWRKEEKIVNLGLGVLFLAPPFNARLSCEYHQQESREKGGGEGAGKTGEKVLLK